MKKLRWMGIVLLLWPPFAMAAHLNATDVEAAMRTALTAMNIHGELVAGSLQFAHAPVLVKTPQLLVERANITTSSRLEARLKCRPAYACLPFHATAQVRLAAALPDDVKRSWSATSQGRVQAGRPMLKPGEEVTFVSEGSGARLLVRAVALERGQLGELVRVRAVDGKHEVLRGRLCGGHVVRSES